MDLHLTDYRDKIIVRKLLGTHSGDRLGIRYLRMVLKKDGHMNICIWCRPVHPLFLSDSRIHFSLNSSRLDWTENSQQYPHMLQLVQCLALKLRIARYRQRKHLVEHSVSLMVRDLVKMKANHLKRNLVCHSATWMVNHLVR